MKYTSEAQKVLRVASFIAGADGSDRIYLPHLVGALVCAPSLQDFWRLFLGHETFIPGSLDFEAIANDNVLLDEYSEDVGLILFSNLNMASTHDLVVDLVGKAEPLELIGSLQILEQSFSFFSSQVARCVGLDFKKDILARFTAYREYVGKVAILKIGEDVRWYLEREIDPNTLKPGITAEEWVKEQKVIFDQMGVPIEAQIYEVILHRNLIENLLERSQTKNWESFPDSGYIKR